MRSAWTVPPVTPAAWGPRRAVATVAGLGLLVLATRFGSTLIEVIDWDESTFALVAQSILRGHLPYAEVFDIKPPLLFFLLAGAMKVFGQSLVVVRLVGDVCVFGAAWATWVVARRLAPHGSAALAAALVVAAGSTYFGRHTGTEWLAAMFTQVALGLLLTRARSSWRAGVAGACLALATLSRTSHAFVMVAGLAVTVWDGWKTEGDLSRTARSASPVAYLGGVLVPLVSVVAPYAVRRQVDLLVLGAITAPAAYAASSPNPLVTLLASTGNLLGSVVWRPWAMAALIVLAAVGGRALVADRRSPDPTRRRQVAVLTAFMAATLLVMASNGYAFSHHLVMLLPFLGVLAAAGLESGGAGRRLLMHAAAVAAVVAAVVVRGPAAWTAAFDADARQVPIRRIAERMANDMNPGDRVWALSHHLVLFYLDIPPVSPLVGHPGNLVKDAIGDALIRAGRIPPDERQRLVNTTPRYVFSSDVRPFYLDENTWTQINGRLSVSHEPWIREEGYVVYRRR